MAVDTWTLNYRHTLAVCVSLPRHQKQISGSRNCQKFAASFLHNVFLFPLLGVCGGCGRMLALRFGWRDVFQPLGEDR